MVPQDAEGEAMSDETYRKMCSHEAIQGMWKPKEGDIVLTTFGLNMIHGRALSSEGDVILDCDVIANHINLIWLPREGDWMEMLSQEHDLEIAGGYKGWITLDYQDDFTGDILNEALCQAFMFTQGFRWNDGWERR